MGFRETAMINETKDIMFRNYKTKCNKGGTRPEFPLDSLSGIKLEIEKGCDDEPMSLLYLDEKLEKIIWFRNELIRRYNNDSEVF